MFGFGRLTLLGSHGLLLGTRQVVALGPGGAQRGKSLVQSREEEYGSIVR